jgi:hypothetical protein
MAECTSHWRSAITKSLKGPSSIYLLKAWQSKWEPAMRAESGDQLLSDFSTGPVQARSRMVRCDISSLRLRARGGSGSVSM